MNLVRVAVAQLELRDGDYGYNFDKLAATVSHLGPQHDLIVLPETVTTGFASRADVEANAETVDGPTVTRLREWSRQYGCTIVCGIAEKAPSKLHNSALVIADGDILLTHRKVQLWRSELDLFAPGHSIHTAPWRGTKIGALICFDIEFPETARAIAAMGGGIVAVCNGNMHPYGPPQRALAVARAIENQMFVVAANRVGRGKRDYFTGGSLIISPYGAILGEAGTETEAVISVQINLEEIQSARRDYSYLDLRKPALAESVK